MSNREALAIPSFEDDLDDFAPRSAPTPGQGRGADARRTVDAVSQFPSREASQDAQLNLKGPKHVLDRFRAMCKADRRTYYDMLEILMDEFDRVK
ncbi:hypothetical protein ACOXXX_19875 [Thalassococcus sp. BH17M4-6]|uniref:hypothetical protein n=1 Tax=Thalassococcus sp. BH17M4-6 TaxID=3413148 RepID=UPI003BEA9CC4